MTLEQTRAETSPDACRVPEERHIFMKLTYTEDAPPDYEPPLFRPATEEDMGAFPCDPFTVVRRLTGVVLHLSAWPVLVVARHDP